MTKIEKSSLTLEVAYIQSLTLPLGFESLLSRLYDACCFKGV